MYKGFSGFSAGENNHGASNHTTYEVIGDAVHLDDPSLIRDADMSRDGMDLVLKGPHDTAIIKGYFAAEMTPTLIGPNGSSLSPALVESFLKSSPDYAHNHSVSDESPVGSVHEVTGKATVTHADGSVHDIAIGTPIYEGDIIETGDHGAVNITFVDETNFAVSENARLAIDEYVFDPATNEGTNDFSVLKGVFVFTSGLIGREDPDDVTIKTPVGSIGIRGTIIAGNADSGEITVVEGAIVLHDTHGNEVTLANQFETAKFDAAGGKIEHLGELTAQDVSAKFSSLSSVAGGLFSSIGDVVNDPAETKSDQAPQEQQAPVQKDAQPESEEGDHQTQNEPQQNQSDTKEAAQGDQPKPEVKAEVQQQAAQMNNDRLGDLNSNLMSGHGSNNGNLQDLSASKAAIASLTQALAHNSNLPLLDFKPVLPPPTIVNDSNATNNPVVYQNNTNNPPPPVNHAPVLTNYAPAEYFKSVTNKTWTHNFGHEFQDADGNNTLTYSLTQATIDSLNGLKGSYLTSTGWAFNSATGILTLNVGSVPATNSSLTLEVLASDGIAAPLQYSHTFTFQKSDGMLSATAIDAGYNDNNSAKILTEGSIRTIEANGHNKTVFLNNTGTDFTVKGDNNTIYIGENANRIVKINSDAIGNKVIGGSQGDHIEIKALNTTVNGLDGDDVVTLYLGSNFGSDLTSFNIDLDSGQKSFSHAYASGESLSLSGLTYGDALVLKDAGSIDFTNAVNLHGIETILTRDAAMQEVKLTIYTVFNMTEDSKTLIFQGDSLDKLNLGASGTETWADTHTRAVIGSETYDVWQGTDSASGQNVTVLVDTDVTVTIV